MKKTIAINICLAGLLAGCGTRDGEKKPEPNTGIRPEAAFPGVKNLSEVKATDFLPTPRHALTPGHNAIYSSTFLYAWNELKKQLKGKVKVDSTDFDFFSINESPYYENSIDPKELDIKVTVEGERVNIKASQQQSLPFIRDLTRYPGPMEFMGSKVECFGFKADDHRKEYMTDILYYKDNKEFALALRPRDTSYEILLYKPARSDFKFLKDVLLDLHQKMKSGTDIITKNPGDWKYMYNPGDYIQIPVISFNYEHEYPWLTGKAFSTDRQKYTIEKAYQRIAFILSEKGAAIEAEAEMEATEEAAPAEEIITKRFVFNSPFLVLVTYKHQSPFFVAWVNNDEVLLKKTPH